MQIRREKRNASGIIAHLRRNLIVKEGVHLVCKEGDAVFVQRHNFFIFLGEVRFEAFNLLEHERVVVGGGVGGIIAGAEDGFVVVRVVVVVGVGVVVVVVVVERGYIAKNGHRFAHAELLIVCVSNLTQKQRCMCLSALLF